MFGLKKLSINTDKKSKFYLAYQKWSRWFRKYTFVIYREVIQVSLFVSEDHVNVWWLIYEKPLHKYKFDWDEIYNNDYLYENLFFGYQIDLVNKTNLHFDSYQTVEEDLFQNPLKADNFETSI